MPVIRQPPSAFKKEAPRKKRRRQRKNVYTVKVDDSEEKAICRKVAIAIMTALILTLVLVYFIARGIQNFVSSTGE